MEKHDHDLLVRLSPTHPKLLELYNEHLQYEQTISDYERRPVHSVEDAMRIRELKKEKLRGMDSIMAILSEHRGEDKVVVNQ